METADFEERKKIFLEWIKTEYKAKMDETRCDFYHYPMFVPNGKGGFELIVNSEIVDITNAGMKSPFQIN